MKIELIILMVALVAIVIAVGWARSKRTVDPIEEWIRELIAMMPQGFGKPGSEFSTATMLEEGLGIYLMHEQDPYWGAESLAEYLHGEGIPVPKSIVNEMLRIAKPSPESCKNINQLLFSNDPNLTMAKFIESLVAIPHPPHKVPPS